jgi:hypothetical protein
MKNWQLILTSTICGVIFYVSVDAANVLIPTISWTIGILSLCCIDYKKIYIGLQ